MRKQERPWLNLFTQAIEELAFGDGYSPLPGECCPWCGRMLYDAGEVVTVSRQRAERCPQPQTFRWSFDEHGWICTGLWRHRYDPCCVYFLHFPAHRVIKIGFSGDPYGRLSAVGSHLNELECGGTVLGWIYGGEAVLENLLHEQHQEQWWWHGGGKRVPRSMELFRPSCKMLWLIGEALRFEHNRPRPARKPKRPPTADEIRRRRLAKVERWKEKAMDKYMEELTSLRLPAAETIARRFPSLEYHAQQKELAEKKYDREVARADAWLVWTEERDRFFGRPLAAT